MRRLLGALSVTVVATTLVLGGCSGGSGPNQARVAAVFDNVVSLVTGQEVNVAGVPVGTVERIELTDDQRALVTMKVDPRFARFYADASCRLGNKFLLGERFVTCDPGRPGSGLLREVDGVPTVPVRHTSAPVEQDLVLSAAQLPYRQRLTIILNELGVGLAARGGDLNEVIRRADPALRDAQTALRVIDRQRGDLRSAIADTDRVLATLARRPDRVARFIEAAANASSRFASRRGDLEQSVRLLPGLLREAEPDLRELDALSVNSTPFVRGLGDSAPSLQRLLGGVDRLSGAARPALAELGGAARVGRRALRAAGPDIKVMRRVAHRLRPVAPTARRFIHSLVRKGFSEGLMRFLFYATRASARFDAISHILPSRGEISQCSLYNTGAPIPECAAALGNLSNAAARRPPPHHRRHRRSAHEPPRPGATRGPPPGPGQPAAPAPHSPQAPLGPGQPAVPGLPGGGDGGIGDILDFLLGQ